jgi:hypothetical protein
VNPTTYNRSHQITAAGHCRSYSGSPLTAYVQSVGRQVDVSVLPATPDEVLSVATNGAAELFPRNKGPEPLAAADKDRPAYRPAAEVLERGTEASKGTWLRWYRGTGCRPDMSRVFCGRCGTFVFYFVSDLLGRGYRILVVVPSLSVGVECTVANAASSFSSTDLSRSGRAGRSRKDVKRLSI